MLTLRRFLVVAALFFWQGGFTFYASVVVPIGQDELGDFQQGFITRRVTNYLNLSGAVALVPLAWDCLACRDLARWRRGGRAFLWLILAVTLAALAWEHGWLDELLQAPGRLNHRLFRPRHRIYLWTSTAQWAAALGFIVLTLRAWQAESKGVQRGIRAEVEGERGSVAAGAAR
jgi:hypothetical protein